MGFVLVNFNLQRGGAPFLRHHRCYETSGPQQMARRTVLRPSRISEARHSGIPLTFLAYLQTQLPGHLQSGSPAAPTAASLVRGPWWECVINGRTVRFQGPPHFHVAAGGPTCIHTQGHTHGNSSSACKLCSHQATRILLQGDRVSA